MSNPIHRTADISPCSRYRWTLGRVFSGIAFGYGLMCLAGRLLDGVEHNGFPEVR